MPRVSEQHLAARRQQILDAARACFTRNGFHATSMQDVISEAGLSVGAFYRYFKSKEQLIGAIAEQTVGTATATVAEVFSQQPPLPLDEAYRRLLVALEPQLANIFPLAMQVWAESLRNPELAIRVRSVYGAMRANFRTLVSNHQRAGTIPADVDPDAVGAVLFGVLLGYNLQRVMLGDPDREKFLTGLRAVLPVGLGTREDDLRGSGTAGGEIE